MVIRDLTEPLKPKEGMNSCIRIQTSLSRLSRRHTGAKLCIIWCPSKVDIPGIQQADTAAKAAASLQQLLGAVPDPASTKAQIRAQLKANVTRPPTQPEINRLLGNFDPVNTYIGNASFPDRTRPSLPKSAPVTARSTVISSASKHPTPPTARSAPKWRMLTTY